MRHDRPCPAAVERQLARALAASSLASGLAITVVDHRSHPWASATFTGARHDLMLAAPSSPALDGWVGALPDAALTLRGHVVASVAMDRIEDDGARAIIVLGVLTLEDH